MPSPANAGQRYPADPLSPDEVRRLVAACSRRGPCGAWDQALLLVLWRCGLRCSEALRLRPSDVGDSSLRVLARLKGGQERVLPLEPGVRAAVDRWGDLRRLRSVPAGAPLFCSLRGRPLDSSHVRRLLPRLGRRAGLDRRVHAHALRHAAAFELAQAGVPVHAIAGFLGHRSIATTAAYVRRLSSAELEAAVAARSCPAWLAPRAESSHAAA